MLRLACAWYCALLLWTTGEQHASNAYQFFGTVLDYQILPQPLCIGAAAVLPWMHLMLAATLIAPRMSLRAPFLATAFLGGLFIAAQLVALARGLPVDCGCFGPLTEHPVGITSLLVAGSLVVAGVTGWATTSCQSRGTLAPRRVYDRDRFAVHHDGDSAAGHERRPSLSIIIPVFNEAATILSVVDAVEAAARHSRWDYEILIVDDGSTDGTGELLSAFAARPRVRLLAHRVNRGKGAAIRTALTLAEGTLTVIQDADLEYSPSEISRLIDEMEQSAADVVYGSRILGARHYPAQRRLPLYSAGVAVLTLCARVLYGLHITDEATGYKLFYTSDLRQMQLTCDRFDFCPEVTAKASRMGLTLVEVPIHYSPRSVAEGKKIGFRDALCAVHTLWRLRRWTPERSTVSHAASPVTIS